MFSSSLGEVLFLFSFISFFDYFCLVDVKCYAITLVEALPKFFCYLTENFVLFYTRACISIRSGLILCEMHG